MRVSDRLSAWLDIKPEWERMVFRLGHRQVMALSRLSKGTVYNLTNNLYAPDRRTIEDARAAVEKWQEAEDSKPDR